MVVDINFVVNSHLIKCLWQHIFEIFVPKYVNIQFTQVNNFWVDYIFKTVNLSDVWIHYYQLLNEHVFVKCEACFFFFPFFFFFLFLINTASTAVDSDTIANMWKDQSVLKA